MSNTKAIQLLSRVSVLPTIQKSLVRVTESSRNLWTLFEAIMTPQLEVPVSPDLPFPRVKKMVKQHDVSLFCRHRLYVQKKKTHPIHNSNHCLLFTPDTGAVRKHVAHLMLSKWVTALKKSREDVSFCPCQAHHHYILVAWVGLWSLDMACFPFPCTVHLWTFSHFSVPKE